MSEVPPATFTPPVPTEPPVATATPPVLESHAERLTALEGTARPDSGVANPWDDPKAAQAEIERLRKENGAARTNAKAAAADEARKELTQSIAKALGLAGEDVPVDPAKLTEQLTTSQAQARQAALELAVFRSSPDSAVANSLLDSRSFLAKVADLDPSDGIAIAAAVGDWVTANPALGKRAPAPNPAQGSSAAGPGTAAQLSEQDVDRLMREGRHDEVEKARIEGRLNDQLGIK